MTTVPPWKHRTPDLIDLFQAIFRGPGSWSRKRDRFVDESLARKGLSNKEGRNEEARKWLRNVYADLSRKFREQRTPLESMTDESLTDWELLHADAQEAYRRKDDRIFEAVAAKALQIAMATKGLPTELRPDSSARVFSSAFRQLSWLSAMAEWSRKEREG